jgi:hypothetical protein
VQAIPRDLRQLGTAPSTIGERGASPMRYAAPPAPPRRIFERGSRRGRIRPPRRIASGPCPSCRGSLARPTAICTSLASAYAVASSWSVDRRAMRGRRAGSSGIRRKRTAPAAAVFGECLRARPTLHAKASLLYLTEDPGGRPCQPHKLMLGDMPGYAVIAVPEDRLWERNVVRLQQQRRPHLPKWNGTRPCAGTASRLVAPTFLAPFIHKGGKSESVDRSSRAAPCHSVAVRSSSCPSATRRRPGVRAVS